MAAVIPTFADLPVVNPQPNGQLPNYPAEDPAATAQAAFGGAVNKAGGALVDIAAYQDLAKNKLEESNATLDLVNRLVPLHTQIATETDPNKIAELRQQYDSLPQTSGQAIADPARRQAWMAKHASTILQAHADADKRLTGLDREQTKADGLTRLDAFVRNGATSDDPNAVAGTLAAVHDNLEWQQRYGSMTPLERRAYGEQYTKKLLMGRASHLLNTGRYEEAQKVVDSNPGALDPGVEEHLRHTIEVAKEKAGVKADIAAETGQLGKGYAGDRAGMRVGGAIAGRIAQAAQDQNIDPTIALATAQIESSMGRNLGSRGNIFQLGKSEWSAVGGGPMGEPGTDIKNGLAWMGKVKSELGDALGREPQGWEIYLAHQQGVAGATKLLNNPSTPAGDLLPARNISANGGDPSAPASAFVSKWRATFQRTAANVAGAVPASGGGEAPSGFDQAVGDSIAVQQVNHGVGGAAAPFKSDGLGPVGTTARVGDSPDQVLQRINTLDKAPPTVFLSSGASNNPDQAGYVGDQIDALKAKGAQNIVVPGVGPGVKNAAAVNASLKSVVEEHGGTFFVPDVKWQKDGVHPAEVDKVRQQGLQALKASAPGPDPLVSSGVVDPNSDLAGEINAAPAAGAAIPLDQQQQGAGLAPLFDIEASMQRTQARADRGEISQARADAVNAGVQTWFNHVQATQANDRATLLRRLSNGAAMLEDGRDFEYDESVIRHFLPKDKADEAIQVLQDSKESGQIVAGVRTASPGDLERQWQQLSANLEDPAATDYAKRRKQLTTLDAAIKKRADALGKDPAGYVAQYSPNVATKFAAIDQAPPESKSAVFADYANAALAEQERLGVPAESRSILPAGVAAAEASKIASLDPAKENPGAALSRMAQSYGDYWPQVFGDLVKAKLPGTYQVLATMDRPDQVVAAADMSRAIGLIAEKGGISALKKAVPDDAQKEIDKALDDRLANFRESTGPQAGGARLYATVRDAAQALAYYNAYRGQGASSAVEAAVNGIVDLKYDFGRIGAGQVRVPKGTLADVEKAAETVQGGITADQLGPIPGNQLLTPEQRKNVWLGAIRSGGWANNEDDSGLVLMGRFRDGAMGAVRRADGSRIEVKFDNAAALARSAPPMQFPANPEDIGARPGQR